MELSPRKKFTYFKYLVRSHSSNRRYSRFYEKYSHNFKTFCLFVGFGRTGSSLLGAMLNAHPDIAMEHEAFFLQQIEFNRMPSSLAPWRRQYIFLPRTGSEQAVSYPLRRDGALGFLMHSAKSKQGGKGFNQFGYSYAIPTSAGWTAGGPKVIGDKSGRITTTYIQQHGFRQFDNFMKSWDLSPSFIHIIRNPYDILTTLCIREFGYKYQTKSLNARDTAQLAKDKTPPDEFNDFVNKHIVKLTNKLDSALDITRKIVDSKKYPIKVLHYDELCSSPSDNLSSLLTFLDVPPHKDYLDACKSVVTPASISRHLLGDIWTPALKSGVTRLIDKYDWLHKYQYES